MTLKTADQYQQKDPSLLAKDETVRTKPAIVVEKVIQNLTL